MSKSGRDSRDKKRRKLALRLVELTGGKEVFMDTVKSTTTQYSDAAFGKLIVKEGEDNVASLVEDMADVYADVFSIKVLEDVIAFYESKSGKDFVNIARKLRPKLAAMGTKWSYELIRSALVRIQKDEADKGINWGSYVPPIDLRW
jgi:hypothetical protein